MMSAVRSRTSIVLGSICVLGTIVVLFGHVRSLEDLSLQHLYIAVSLVTTLGAGHFMWEATALRSIAFAILFLVGTLVCVGLSGGRSAHYLQENASSAQAYNAERQTLASRVAQAQQARDDAQRQLSSYRETVDKATASAQAECNTGKGKRCEGQAASTALVHAREQQLQEEFNKVNQAYWDAHKAHNQFQPRTANGELAHLAHAISFLFNIPQERAMAFILVFLPYFLSLLTEFGGIVFLNHGFSSPSPSTTLPTITPPVVDAVTVNDIAQQLSRDPREVRKRLRELHVPKPPQGWVWSKPDAEALKVRLQASP